MTELLIQDSVQIHIDPSLGALMDQLAPGVAGYTMEEGETLLIPLLYSFDPGKGHVGRYLDSLPRDRKVIVPNVINHQLAGMLGRGFFYCPDILPDEEEAVDGWVREPHSEGGPNGR